MTAGRRGFRAVVATRTLAGAPLRESGDSAGDLRESVVLGCASSCQVATGALGK
jgi:hypothetical protein